MQLIINRKYGWSPNVAFGMKRNPLVEVLHCKVNRISRPRWPCVSFNANVSSAIWTERERVIRWGSHMKKMWSGQQKGKTRVSRSPVSVSGYISNRTTKSQRPRDNKNSLTNIKHGTHLNLFKLITGTGSFQSMKSDHSLCRFFKLLLISPWQVGNCQEKSLLRAITCCWNSFSLLLLLSDLQRCCCTIQLRHTFLTEKERNKIIYTDWFGIMINS